MQKVINHPIRPTDLLQINTIFKANGWGAYTSSTKKYTLANNYVERTKLIPQANRQLFYDLTKRFKRLDLLDLIPHLVDAYNNVDSALLANARKIYFLALKDYISSGQQRRNLLMAGKFKSLIQHFRDGPQDTKIHGADLLVNLFEKSEYRTMAHSSKFIFPSNFEKFKSHFKPKVDLLILIDDFTGTGDTAIKALKILYKKKRLGSKLFSEKNTIILNLLSQSEGVKMILNDQRTKVFQKTALGKGITDHYPVSQIEIRLKEMKTIEKSVDIDPRVSLGYGKSEALVSICGKCPNNTFPVFWHETKKHAAPFPRRKIFNS